VERGVARLTGMMEIEAGGIYDYEIKAEKVMEAMDVSDCVYIHLKGLMNQA